MSLDEMRRLDALKTYKELEEAKKTIDALTLRVKHDFETILKFKAENELLTSKIDDQKRTIKELEEVNEYLRQKNDKLEYGRTSK